MKRAVLAAFFAACVWVDPDPAGLGAPCVFNGDCASPLVCAGMRCRAPCRDDRDCVNGWRCRPSGAPDRRVCLAPELAGFCRFDGDCEAPRVCRAGGVCGAQCESSSDCRSYSPSGTLRCVTVSTAAGEALGVCENHPWLRDGAAPDVARDATVDVARADITAPSDRVVVDAPRDVADAGSALCPTSVAGACTPGEGCALRGVSLTAETSCAWFEDGSVRCWGDRSASALVSAQTSAPCYRPAVRLAGVDAREVAVSSYMVCLRAGDGRVRCWGQGSLGDGRSAPTTIDPVTVEVYPDDGPLEGATRLSAHQGQSACVVAGASRELYCWGRNEGGQLGIGTSVARQRATLVPLLDAVDAMVTGASHTCVLRAGLAWCLGAPVWTDAGAATLAQRLPSLDGATQLSAGWFHTCGVFADRTVRCVGEVWRGGELPETSTTAVPVAGITDVEELVGLRYGSNCARRGDGTVWCWGAAEVLGDGSDAPRTAPAPVPGMTGVQRVFGRDTTACALRGAAELWCWGRNTGGGSAAVSTRPVRIAWGDGG